MAIDIIIVTISFVAFFWLSKFEKIEDANLSTNTVNASMYTVVVTNLPPECSEVELKRHFVRMLAQIGQESISKIASVSLAFNNTSEILESMRRGDIIREKIKAVHKHRYNCTVIRNYAECRGKANEVKGKLARMKAQLNKQIKRFNEDLKRAEDNLDRLGQAPTEPLYAFVTFDRVAAKEALIAKYNSFSGLYRMLYSTELDLRGSKLVVRQATEPSTIIWENLAYSKLNRFARRFVTTLLALLMICVSLVMIFAARYLQLESRSSSSYEDDAYFCPSRFYSMTRENQQLFIVADPEYTSCYCDQFSSVSQSRDQYCSEYFKKNEQSQALTYCASFIVLVVNQSMEYMLLAASDYEKHHTEDGKSRSIFFRLFVLKYINTSLVFFINNNRDILGEVFGIDAPARRDIFTSDWFNNVGVTLMLVQLGDIFLSHGFKCFQYFYFLCQRSTSTYLSQDELNRSYVGPSFELAFKYAQLMSTFFCCFTFSTGIPILYAFSAANFGLYYLVEKFLFIRLYRIPPHFSNVVGVFATSLVPYALVIHLGMSIWVLSDKTIFDSRSGVTVILAVLLVLLAMSVVAAWIFSVFSKQIMKVWRLCCGVSRWKIQSDAKPVHAHVSFTRAVQRNLIRGLSSYNILQNPAYKEAFAITWKFAMDHNTVREVRSMKVRAGQANDDIDPDLEENMPFSDAQLPAAAPYNSDGTADNAGLDSFLAPAAAVKQHSLQSNSTSPSQAEHFDPYVRSNPRLTPRRTPIPAPHRTPAAVTSLHPAPSQHLILRDLQPQDRGDDSDAKMEQKSADPVAIAVAVTEDGRDALFRDTPPLATVRQGRSRLHVPAHIPLPPVRLPPTSNQRQQQQQNGWEPFDHLLY